MPSLYRGQPSSIYYALIRTCMPKYQGMATGESIYAPRYGPKAVILKGRWWLAPVHSHPLSPSCLLWCSLPRTLAQIGIKEPAPGVEMVNATNQTASHRSSRQSPLGFGGSDPKKQGIFISKTGRHAMRALLLASRALIGDGEQESMLRFGTTTGGLGQQRNEKQKPVVD